MKEQNMDNLRHFTRVKIDLGGELMYRDKAFAVQVADISLGGSYLQSSLPLRVNDIAELRIFLSHPEHVIEVQGRIAWTKDDRSGFGIEFQNLKPIDIWAILKQTQIDPKEAFQMPKTSTPGDL